MENQANGIPQQTLPPALLSRLVLALCFATAPLFLFPKPAWLWVLGLIPAVWAAGLIAGRSVLPATPLNWPIELLLAAVLFSVLMSPDPYSGLAKTTGILLGVCLFFALMNVLIGERTLRLTFGLYLLGGLGFFVTGILGMMWFKEGQLSALIPKIEGKFPKVPLRLAGAETGFNPNAVAGTLLLIIPAILLYAAWRNGEDRAIVFGRPLEKLLLCIFGLLCLVELFFTLSYGAWIALLAAMWLMGLGRKWKKISLLALLLVGGLFFVKGAIVNKANVISELGALIEYKLEGRDQFWRTGLRSVAQHPLFGVGLNRLRLEAGIGYGNAHAHNMFIHTAAEIGLPGLIAYVAILLNLAGMARRVWRGAKRPWMRAAARGLGAGQLAYFLFGLGDAIPLGAKPGVLFWISLALIASMYAFVKNEERGGGAVSP